MRGFKMFLLVISLCVMWPVQSPGAQSQEHANHRNKNGSVQPKRVTNDQQNTFERSTTTTGSAPIIKQADSPEEKGAREPDGNSEQIKLSVDLVVLDAQVMQQKTARVVGDLKREDFALYEDGVKQQITHFSQDTLPLSVILLVDRGGCLDPFGASVSAVDEESKTQTKSSEDSSQRRE